MVSELTSVSGGLGVATTVFCHKYITSVCFKKAWVLPLQGIIRFGCGISLQTCAFIIMDFLDVAEERGGWGSLAVMQGVRVVPERPEEELKVRRHQQHTDGITISPHVSHSFIY